MPDTGQQSLFPQVQETGLEKPMQLLRPPTFSAWGMSSNPSSAQTLLCLTQATLPRPQLLRQPPHPSPQTRNMSLENVTSSQGNLGSFIAERPDGAAANLQTRGGGAEGNWSRKMEFGTTYKSILQSLDGLTSNIFSPHFLLHTEGYVPILLFKECEVILRPEAKPSPENVLKMLISGSTPELLN